MKKFLQNVLPFLCSGLLLWWLSTRLDLAHIVSVIRSADLKFIFLALIVFFILNFILIGRWFVFIKALDLSVPFATAFRFYLFGLCCNLFLPSAIGGDVIKIIGVCKGSNEKPKVVASVLIDRLSGFAGMVVVAVVSFIIGFRLVGDRSTALAILFMAMASTSIGLVLFNRTIYSFFTQIFTFIPVLKNALMKMHEDLSLLKGRQSAIYKAVGLSALSQLTLAVTFFLISKALHQDISLFYFIIFVPLICVASSVPSVGGLGVREAGAAYFLGKVGVSSEIAVSISLISFVFMVIVGLLSGVYFLLTRPASQKS